MSRMHSHSAIVAATVLLGSLGAVSFAPQAHAATLNVTNCNDSGPGSLRATIAAAASGDTIDLRNLSCRVIRTTSVLSIPQGSLTLQGPGYRRLSVDIDWSDSVLRHTGGGLLRLRGISLVHGTRRAPSALGGCVYSNGAVDVYDTSISHCGALASGPGTTFGMGGGIYAEGDVTVRYSVIFANSGRGSFTAGGGVFSGGKVTLLRARIIQGVASRGGGVYATNGLSADTVTFFGNFALTDGAAINARGPVSIANSTISNNTAVRSAGGLWIEGAGPALIVNSTISNNRADRWSAGFITPDVDIANSTIAFNRVAAGVDEPECADEGALGIAGQLHLESSIASNSTCIVVFDETPQHDIAIVGTDPVIGNDNLVTSANQPMPADTITVDPVLGALADNGGRTQTHALPAASPAVDVGNNAAGLAFDQRGVGFPRVNNGRADIGAFER